ncbi:bifunctional 23S rRNA (guanine(2069)-N(7))-methyltransferase RlmK/23S rRNA (guanine(2445)-N(2))-methyltransferase RlmL [Motilimonas pumila]|uniref:Ribosomal RNA large subunit methyltransferase K/L n=1 Tax=Motilimonas pumila TaxID=2303987 RepID=A0A418YFJ2_9GAMM|nr:bifunctional 23S rRNA (guanine(2069)-N(7))-methyltransferase RlmK/23S rRNA (guanine(2445)-N(2))-methyltransferase RlmL [Motilimonas pumila]RJG48145.1 bifunctional 23S rRNA (guanine(2069)-N(7))-methyltransferase RlmK/23S rRNA (guanine(2445)-N(2))-methyltransferase RlmL [Motilimonas pumila]
MSTTTSYDYFVTCAQGLEPLVEEELKSFGIEQVKAVRSGVNFSGSKQQGYQVCLWSRYASRVLLRLSEFKVHDVMDLYLGCSYVAWEDVFDIKKTFAIDFSGKNEEIRNTQFGALKVKDAIVDRFRKKLDDRPNVEKGNSQVRINVRLFKDKAHVYLDLAGSPLHHRGYKTETGAAPLKENLAAAIVRRSGWQTDTHMLDPMCGSGTLVIEAALMATNRAPGLLRDGYAFEHWKDHDVELWTSMLAQAQVQNKRNENKSDTRFYANDKSRRLIEIARSNAQRAGVADLITFSVKDATELGNPLDGQTGHIISNPPYGERMGEMTGAIELYSNLGNRFKKSFPGWQVSLFSTDTELLSCIGLRASKTYKLFNGPLECVLKNYSISERSMASDKPAIYATDFANRLKKNLQQRRKWAKREGVDCFRLYDADLPEYNVAIDLYVDHLVVQEYAPPKNIDPAKARRRILDVVATARHVLEIPEDKLFLKVREVQKGKSQYQTLNKKQSLLSASEYNALFEVNLSDYLDTGLFLDHRPTRKKLGELAQGKHFLNLFCYTASASVHAALGGAASTTSVDMSNTYIDWAKRNFQLNKIKGAHHFEQADCLKWLDHCQHQYDLIFIDPPTFSNSKRMQGTFDVQRDHVELLQNARKNLTTGGVLVFSNNKRGFKLDHDAVNELGFEIQDFSKQSIPEDFKRNDKIHQCWILTLCR